MWKFYFSYMDEIVDFVCYMWTLCQNACVPHESDCSATWPLATWLQLTQNNALAAHWCIQKKDYSRETSKASGCLAETNAEGETVEEIALEASMLHVCGVSAGKNTKRLLHQGRAAHHMIPEEDSWLFWYKDEAKQGLFLTWWPQRSEELGGVSLRWQGFWAGVAGYNKLQTLKTRSSLLGTVSGDLPSMRVSLHCWGHLTLPEADPSLQVLGHTPPSRSCSRRSVVTEPVLVSVSGWPQDHISLVTELLQNLLWVTNVKSMPSSNFWGPGWSPSQLTGIFLLASVHGTSACFPPWSCPHSGGSGGS